MMEFWRNCSARENLGHSARSQQSPRLPVLFRARPDRKWLFMATAAHPARSAVENSKHSWLKIRSRVLPPNKRFSKLIRFAKAHRIHSARFAAEKLRS